ncbi:MAG: hypothetical protein R2744_08445 [Bacteroidales bacterium]
MGFWENMEEIRSQWQIGKVMFKPQMDMEKAGILINEWHIAVKSALAWTEK